MAEDIQGMLIRIEATTAQLRRELSTADRAVGDTSQKIDKHLGIADNAFDRLNSTAVGALKGLLLPIASVSSAVAGLSKAVEVQRQFDKLNAGLITATGSAVNAASAFDALQSFAQKTPYDLNQAVEGFTQLVNLGLTPSEKALTSYGNTAAALGKDLSQLLEAVADATTGEFERLKEFGIKASQSGDKVALTFQGVTKSIGNNAAEIENYLIALGENEFAGAMATRMATLDGALAGLGDSWDQLFRNINEAGLGELMQNSVNLASDALDELNALISSGQLEGYLQAIGDKFDGFGRDVAASVGVIQQAWMDATDEIQRGGMAYAGAEVVNFITDAFRNLPENVRAFVQLMVTEVAAGLDTAAAYARAFKESTKAVFTDDTQEAVAARLQADLERLNGVRADSIASILAERDASLQSFSDRIKAADQLREKSDSDQAAAAQATVDRLAQYKKVGSAATAASAETEKAAKKEADSFQRLLDSLLPADAASRKYSETLATLDKGLIVGSLSLDTYQSAVEAAWQSLNKSDWEKQNKALDEQNQLVKKADDQFKSLRDRLDPAAAAAEQYAKDQDFLNQRFAQGNMSVEEYARLLGLLDQEYQQNSASSNEWAKFTERQLDRVDQAFSDAWLNIGHGFDSFASSLKRAFEQMLAELAHMAITRPIMLQIGSALGIGGLTGSTMGTGLWGSLSGGSGVLGTLGGLYSAYSTGSGVIGGIANAGKFIGSGVSSTLSGLDASAGRVFGQLFGSPTGPYAPASFQLESAINRMGASAAGFASQLGLSTEAIAKFGAALSTAGDIASVAGAIYNVYSGFKDGIANGIVTAAGAAIGSFFGPTGAAIGSTIGKFVGGALFGTWKVKDYGVALGVQNGDLKPQNYTYWKKKGLLSSKKKTDYDPLGGDLAKQLQDTFASTEDSVSSLFEKLGYDINQGTFDGLQIARSKISTKGKTQDEISKAIGDWFTQAGESINSYLNATLGTGLSYDIAGMTTFVNDLYAVNGLLDHLNVGLFSTNVAGGKLVEQLLGLTGGLDSLTTSVSTYYDQFFSDAEKQANTVADVRKAFADANQTLPATRAEYRAMVESIDLTTEAGRSMFATLMNLAGQADSYYDIVEQRAQAVQAATSSAAVSAAKGALSTLSSAIGAEQQRLSDAYNARVASINDRVGTANSTVSSLTAVGSSLDAALKQLSGSSEQATALLHEQAVATLRSALAFAKAGGSLAGFAGLQNALDAATNISSSRYSTLEDLQREQGRTANLIAQLQGVNGTQLTTEQRILDSLQGQLDQAKADYDLQTSGLDAQLTAAQAQLDALLGIDSGVKSVADALSLFAGSMQQAQALQNANSSITSVTGLAGVKRQVASDGTILDEHGQSMGLKVVGNQVVGTQSWNQDWLFNIGQDGQMSWAAGQQANIQEWAKSQGIPGFATGGAFTNSVVRRPTEFSTAVMGEAGPEAILPLANVGGSLGVRAVIPGLDALQGPQLDVPTPLVLSRSSPSADAGSAASAEEIRGLRADMAQVFDALRAIAKHTMQTAKRAEFLERWDYDGMPTVRA